LNKSNASRYGFHRSYQEKQHRKELIARAIHNISSRCGGHT